MVDRNLKGSLPPVSRLRESIGVRTSAGVTKPTGIAFALPVFIPVLSGKPLRHSAPRRDFDRPALLEMTVAAVVDLGLQRAAGGAREEGKDEARVFADRDGGFARQ